MTTYNHDDIWGAYQQHAKTREIDLYIERVLFDSTQLIEEGMLGNIGSALKSVGSKVKDAISRYNPQDLYNQAYAKIANQKDMLVQKHPKAAKLFQLAANPTNIRVALMAATLLGTLVGVDMGNAEQMMADLPEDDGALADQLAQAAQAAENVRDGEEALDGTMYDPDQLAKSDINMNYQGIDDHINQLVASGAMDQQAADNLLMCIEMKSGLELGSFIEGVTMDSYSEFINQSSIITDDSGITLTSQDTSESYIQTTITDKNGQTIKLAEMKTTMSTDHSTGNVSIQKETGGLDFDIITMMEANIKQLPPEQQEELWTMINAREMSGLGLEVGTDGPGQGQFDIPKELGGHGKPEYQVHDTAQKNWIDVSKQFASNPPLRESSRDSDLIWESYLTESNKQQAVTSINQLVAQYLSGLRNLAVVMAQLAISKQIPVGQAVTAKQL